MEKSPFLYSSSTIFSMSLFFIIPKFFGRYLLKYFFSYFLFPMISTCFISYSSFHVFLNSRLFSSSSANFSGLLNFLMLSILSLATFSPAAIISFTFPKSYDSIFSRFGVMYKSSILICLSTSCLPAIVIESDITPAILSFSGSLLEKPSPTFIPIV